ncbi:MAG: 30S ribosomal protein S3 [Acidimicrobiia bacterium]
MGQKIHPYGLRLGIVTDWKSRWYSEKDYAANVNQDHQIRVYLRTQLKRGALSRIDIERIGNAKVQVDVHTARPGVVIGRGGSEAERLRTGLEKLTKRIVKFNVIEVQNAELDATLLARSVADQLEGRVAFRRAMKRAVATALKAGAEGVRVQAAGRLGGADMGRREWYLEGRVPLHTLRADIDFGQATAATSVGAIGVQVWVYKGDVVRSAADSREKIAAEARLAAGGPSERRRSAKSRAEAAAGEGGGRRLIEAGGGKRVVEAGGGKRPGRRLIEAGGGRKLTTSDAAAEFDLARSETDEAAVPEVPAVPEDAPEVVDAAAASELTDVGGQGSVDASAEPLDEMDAIAESLEAETAADEVLTGTAGATEIADVADVAETGPADVADVPETGPAEVADVTDVAETGPADVADVPETGPAEVADVADVADVSETGPADVAETAVGPVDTEGSADTEESPDVADGEDSEDSEDRGEVT